MLKFNQYPVTDGMTNAKSAEPGGVKPIAEPPAAATTICS